MVGIDKQKPHGSKPYLTPDLYFAATLLCAEVHFNGIVRDQKGRAKFSFTDTLDAVADIRQDYYNRTCKVDALTYSDRVKSLKSLCHADT